LPSGFNQGQQLPPGFNQGQQLPPGFNQGQQLPPGFNQGQQLPFGFNQGQQRPNSSVSPSAPSQPSSSPAPSPATPPSQTSSPHHLKVLLPQMIFRPQAIEGINVQRVRLHYTIADCLIALNKLEVQAELREVELRRRQTELSRLADNLQAQYEGLWKDPEVRVALDEINTTANPKVSLGPRLDYRKNLERMTTELLEGEGLRRKNKSGIFSVAYVAALEQRVKKSEEELKNALALQEHQKREAPSLEYLEQITRDAVQKKDQGRIAKLQKEQRDRDAAHTKSTRGVATWREAYVQSVAVLRKACEEAPQKIAEWKKKHPDIQIEDLSPSVKVFLERAEASMTTSEIPLEVDKTVNCVQAVVEGIPLKMILKPDVNQVRLSASSAEALGITRPGVDVGVREEVEMEDGQKLPARRVTLKSVQVGPFKAEDHECLVFLKGYETDPILGAGFLNQFAYRIDPEAGRLILTRVDVKPSSKPSLMEGLEKKKRGSSKPGR
jgi:hypothetical protein